MQDLKKDLNDIQTLFKIDFTKAADDATNWATQDERCGAELLYSVQRKDNGTE